jgi:hypothetical protein
MPDPSRKHPHQPTLHPSRPQPAASCMAGWFPIIRLYRPLESKATIEPVRSFSTNSRPPAGPAATRRSPGSQPHRTPRRPRAPAEVGASSSGGLWLAAVRAQAGSFLFLDGFVDVPEVGAPAPFGMGLVLVVAIARQAGTFPLFHDGVVHVPQVGASAPSG